ncbi:MAG TPA: dihydrolipoamide acetyltransferase family protein, partial [Acidimicrobiales bacterium]|nr:dihydrolipoamide acetyltransferase family protein [Acidimicrobiales bacterium]
MADITMPQLGETVTEGTITKWFKSVGDEISEDEPLFEVSTDKVDSEVPSPASGYVAEILVEEGETVDVGTKLAVVSSEAPSGNGKAEKKESEDSEDKAEAAEDSEAEEDESEDQQEDDEAAEEVPEEDQAAEEDEAPEEEARPAKAEAEAEKAKAPTKTEAPPEPKAEGDGRGNGGGGKVLSPVVRKLIAEHDLDPDQIEGTGQGGRITRADVLSVIDTGKSKAAPKEQEKEKPKEKAAGREERREETPSRAAPQPARAERSDGAQVSKAGSDDETVAFTNIRRRTAEHMVRSKSTSAHVLTAIEVDFENVDGVRRAAQAEWKEREGFTLTYLPFISRAVIDAIEDYPHVNASVGDDELIVHRNVHLGIAVDLSFQGLLAPVIHDAEGKRLRAIAREIHDLAARARAKKLSADEIQGGTFTITNPGGYGTLITAPIINQP